MYIGFNINMLLSKNILEINFLFNYFMFGIIGCGNIGG